MTAYLQWHLLICPAVMEVAVNSSALSVGCAGRVTEKLPPEILEQESSFMDGKTLDWSIQTLQSFKFHA